MINKTVGRMYRKILRARPGRKPCRNDLMNFLHIDKKLKGW
jgi:hypothetical protein